MPQPDDTSTTAASAAALHHRDLPDLSGLVVVVTGGAGGVGAGIVRRFAAAGSRVVVHFHRSQVEAQSLVAEVRSFGGEAVAIGADITQPDECAALMQAAVDAYGQLDALVNNAGVQPVQPLDSMTLEEWRTVVDTNLTGTFNATQAAVAHLRAVGGGSITHIASIEGTHPAAGHAHYSASKAAIIMHARSAALEYGSLGIRVNSVSPGLIDRDGLAEEWPDGVARWTATAPLGRLGSNLDIGNACVFLASPMASFITGHDLVVDGGVSAHPTW